MKRLSTLLQYLPNFKGKMRLVNFIFKPLLQKRNILIKAKNGVLFNLPNLIEPVGKHLFINGEYEIDEINFVKNAIRKNNVNTFLDIGANIGLFSLSVAKEFPTVAIFAIEASPRVYTTLQDNIMLNHLQNIKAIQLGLANTDTAELSFYSDETKYGTGSFAPIFTDKAEMVKCAKLDTLISNEIIPTNIQLIKIDVEGFELQVFQGAAQLLEHASALTILFEFVDWAEQNAGNKKGAAQEYLISLNYSLFKLHKNKLLPLTAALKTGNASLVAIKNNN